MTTDDAALDVPFVRGGHSPALQYQVALGYYAEHATQAELAEQYGVSRTAISRILAEARASGIVHIEVREPSHTWLESVSEHLRAVLGLRAAFVEPPSVGKIGPALAFGVRAALKSAELAPGDVLLVSSGTTLVDVSRLDLPTLPGVIVAPTTGGQQEQDPSYQTNEIARRIADHCGGNVALLYAPAQPSQELYDSLLRDPSVQRVLGYWKQAKCALIGVGAPATGRAIMPATLANDLEPQMSAVGDMCIRPFDREGNPIHFSGTERLISTDLEDLKRIPHCVAIAAGAAKVTGLITAARVGYFNTLVTDLPTAQAIFAELAA